VKRAGKPQRTNGTISRRENHALVRHYYDELWNAWNLSVADEIISPEITFRGSLGVTVKGLDGFKRYVTLVRDAFPDFQNIIEEIIAEGDRVAARLTYRGTHRGELFGIMPTGREVTYAGVAMFQIGAGRIVAGWVLGDTLGLMRQLGAVRDSAPASHPVNAA
jgi:predicted ester cyclase